MLCTSRYAVTLAITAVLALGACDNNSNSNPVEPAGVLPADPAKWVCESNPTPPTEQEIASWCADNAGNGTVLPPALRTPPPTAELAAKNLYDQELQAFLREQAYQTELNWASDKQWRLTGPPPRPPPGGKDILLTRGGGLDVQRPQWRASQWRHGC